MPEANLFQKRGRVAALSRSRTADDPEFIAARQDLAATKLELYVARVIEAAPPLAPEQRDRIAALLAPRGADAL